MVMFTKIICKFIPLQFNIPTKYLHNIKWACARQNQQNDMRAQQRLRSAWVSAQADQSLRWAHRSFRWFVMHWLTYKERENSDEMIYSKKNCLITKFRNVQFYWIFQTGFRDQDFSILTVLAMTLGEMNYVDVFVDNNNYPFTVDSYILVGIFMLMMPIALVNLLVSNCTISYEPRHEKTCLWGLRPGKTQTGMLSYRG